MSPAPLPIIVPDHFGCPGEITPNGLSRLQDAQVGARTALAVVVRSPRELPVFYGRYSGFGASGA
jgi:hypothetical protein